MRKYVLLVMGLMIAISGLYGQENLYDMIYLNNGTIIRGIIIEHIPGQRVKIRKADGNEFILQMKNVEKIIRESPLDLQSKPDDLPPEKVPVVAMFLSVFPDLGQYYNGQYI